MVVCDRAWRITEVTFTFSMRGSGDHRETHPTYKCVTVQFNAETSLPIAQLHYLRGVLEWLLVVALFAPQQGRAIKDMLRLLRAVRHGTEALIYSTYLNKAAASTSLAIIFGQVASDVPWLLCSTVVPMHLPHAVVGPLTKPAIECLSHV